MNADLPYPRAQDRIVARSHVLFLRVVGIGVVGVIAWAALTEIDRVARGPGRIVPETQNQIVQHLEGGIVSEILVREGERVERGQPVMRVENTFFRAELAQARIDIKAKTLRLARLEAETRGVERPELPQDLELEIPDIAEGERAVFARRQSKLAEELSILDDQIRQKQIELSELRSRMPSVEREKQIAEERFTSLQRLTKIGAASTNELLETERLLQQVFARSSDLAHAVPRTQAALSEIERRKTDATMRFRSDAERERTDTLLEIAKLKEAMGALQDRSRRSDVVAPVAGIINKLFVQSVGGVVKSGEPIAQIVPADASITVEMRLAPSDRAEVWPGQKAVVKVSAYEFSVYGGMPARVVDISPDALQDERNQTYFRVKLEADAKAFGPDRPVVPGMLADVDVLAGRHTVLGYLLTPINRIREKAFRQ